MSIRPLTALRDHCWSCPSYPLVFGRLFGTSVTSANVHGPELGSAAEQLRMLMRRVTQPGKFVDLDFKIEAIVVLVTTEDADCRVQRGLTISSFTTICLIPSPFVCFSTRQVSRAADLIAQRESFTVHLLPSTAKFAKLAEAFSKSDLAAHSHGKHQNPFDFGKWRRDKTWNLPVFDGVLGSLRCRVERTVDVGDHRLWIAEVEDVAVDDSIDGTALGYCERKYRKEGDALFPHDASEE